jgi:hypothetical protein
VTLVGIGSDLTPAGVLAAVIDAMAASSALWLYPASVAEMRAAHRQRDRLGAGESHPGFVPVLGVLEPSDFRSFCAGVKGAKSQDISP